jgi:hypothetical protein
MRLEVMQKIWHVPVILLVFLMAFLTACGGGSGATGTNPPPVSNAIPSVTQVSPNSAFAGSGDLTVTITGANFINSSVASFGAIALKTTVNSSTQITAVIPAGLMASGAVNNVTVSNPAPGGGTSGAAAFTVNNPQPSVTSVSPNPVHGSDSVFTIIGSSFVPTSNITLVPAGSATGRTLSVTFVSSTKLTAPIPAGLPAGTISLSVSNSAPGGGTSSALTAQVNATAQVVPTLATWRPGSAHRVRFYTNSGGVGNITADGGTFANPTWNFDNIAGNFNNLWTSASAGTFHVTIAAQGDPTATAPMTVVVDPMAGVFSQTGTPAARHGQEFTLTLLPNGKVLILGGDNGKGTNELFDPATGTFSAVPPMLTPRYQHTATLLTTGPNAGSVLITGGIDSNISTPSLLSSAELYDPATNTFHPAGNMTAGRRNHAAVLLANGDVLIVGGSNGVPKVAEVYSASSGAFHATSGLMVVWRFLPTATLLPSGKVLIVGGVDATPATAGPVSSAELYDPSTGKFTATGSMAFARFDHFSILLPDGKVWVGGNGDQLNPIAQYEEYDSATGTFSIAGSSQLVRTTFSANLLANGKILVVAGSNSFEAVQGCELFDPATGISIFTDSLSVVRGFQHHSITLSNGTVFVIGGEPTTTTAQPAELYTP